MRVRYGKPIKVKSLLGKQNVSYSFPNNVLDNGYFIYAKSDNSFAYGYRDSITSQAKAFTVASGHKYFAYTSWSISTQIYTNVHNGHRFALISDTSTDTGNASTFSATSSYGYSLVEPSFSGSCEVGTCNYNQTQASGDEVYYMIIIDLTEAFGSGKEPTAQEFYNKYNKYFPLIATGEEITIDDKAGQVSYSSQKSLKSIVGKQIGLTADSSFQEYSITSTPTVALGDNKFGYSTVIKQASRFAEGVSIISGHQYFISVNVHNMIDRSTQRWMCIRFTAGKTGQTMLTDNKYSYQWYFTSDRVNAVLTATSSGDLGYVYFGDFPSDQKMTIATEYPESYLIVDLTDTFGVGNEPTAETFYTNYHNLFKDLENGKGLVIGKGKVAGGSSDIYYGYNQQIENGQFENGTDRWFMQNGTFSVHDGIATFTQTDLSVGFTRFTQKLINPSIIGHKYFVHFYAKHDHPTTINLKENSNHNTNTFDVPTNTWTLCEVISTSDVASNYATISTRNSELTSVCNVDIRDYFVIDLTDWYGAGKEPSTVQGFKERFAKDYYGFCPTPVRLTRYQIENEPTYGYNQIADINRSTATIRGISFVNNGNNTLTITGTSQKSDNISIGNMEIVEGHKYYGFTNVISGALSTSTYWIKWVSASYGKDIGEGVLFTATSSANPAYCSFYVEGANIGINAKIQMMLIDLTDWYGEGSEPTTIEEFKATFPNKHYPYGKKRLLNKYMINKLENYGNC